MSSISGIKQNVMQVGEEAKQKATQITALASSLEKSIAAVNSAIGGTASGADKQMVASFQMAIKAMKEASQSLIQAGNTAKDWASRA